jgi:hypothetical protein
VIPRHFLFREVPDDLFVAGGKVGVDVDVVFECFDVEEDGFCV